MRVLFTAQPGSGHWRPLAPVARALTEAGHDVAFAATPVFCQLISEHSFRCFPIGVDDWLTPVLSPAGTLDHSDAASVYRHVFLPRSRRHLTALMRLCRDWRPDVVVREQSEFAGYLVAELLDLPLVTVPVSAFRPQLDQLLTSALEEVRAELGLRPDPDLARLYRDLLLLPFPPALLAPGTVLPPGARFVEHVPFDRQRPGDDRLPEWVTSLPAGPTVLVTFGTADAATSETFATILAGLRDEPINVIVTLNDQDPAQFGAQPPNVHLVPYLPLSLLVPHCDLVVTHGGSGTVRTTLALGRTLVILPLVADQPDNARRCEQLGVACVVPREVAAPESVREATRDVLSESQYRRQVRILQAGFRALPSLTSAVQLIERLS